MEEQLQILHIPCASVVPRHKSRTSLRVKKSAPQLTRACCCYNAIKANSMVEPCEPSAVFANIRARPVHVTSGLRFARESLEAIGTGLHASSAIAWRVLRSSRRRSFLGHGPYPTMSIEANCFLRTPPWLRSSASCFLDGHGRSGPYSMAPCWSEMLS